MAKTNKYTSINFNHIYEKNLPSNSTSNSNPKPKTPSSSTSFSYSAISSANKTHGGRMLVLTRPTPKPISVPQVQPLPQPQPQPQTQPQPQPQPQALFRDPLRAEPGSDEISLRPLGRTGGGGSPVLIQEREKEKGAPVQVVTPKTDKFVPPHLRPGFVGREERPGPEVIRAREMGQRHFGSPARYGEEGGRPKSGGGQERLRRGGDHSDLAMMNRPGSSGNRPSSS